jgi:hypothetical protein
MMKLVIRSILLVLITLVSSCNFFNPSPSSVGVEVAELYNNSLETFSSSQSEVLNQFAVEFMDYNFTTRIEARKVAREKLKPIIDKFNSDMANADLEYQRAQSKYAGNYEERLEFQNAFNKNITLYDVDEIIDNAYKNPNLDRLIKSIIPPKPDASKLSKDLIGRKIKEPSDGYKQGNRVWTIAEGEIKDFKIIEINEENSTLVYNCEMVLQAEGGSLRVKCRVRYILEDYDDWTIQTLYTDSFEIVKTGMYDSCVEVSLRHGFGDTLKLVNNCDVALAVGLAYYDGATWEKIEFILNPVDQVTWRVLTINDFKVHYIELPL